MKFANQVTTNFSESTFVEGSETQSAFGELERVSEIWAPKVTQRNCQKTPRGQHVQAPKTQKSGSRGILQFECWDQTKVLVQELAD